MKRGIAVSSIIGIIALLAVIGGGVYVYTERTQELDGMPYCNVPEEGYHLSLATDYIESIQPDYIVVKESKEHIGPCNNGNTAWTQFDVHDPSGMLVGVVVVNGDTDEITFTMEDDEPLPADEVSCKQAGGMWLDISNSAEILGDEAYECFLPNPVPGKICTDSAQCGGAILCLANEGSETGEEAEGVCAEYWTESGNSYTPCWQTVEGGIVQNTTCY